MLRYREGLDEQQPREDAEVSVFSSNTQPPGSPVWQNGRPPASTINSTNVTGTNAPVLPPSAGIKTNIVCLPPKSSSPCAEMECSPVVESDAAFSRNPLLGFANASYIHSQAPAPAPADTAMVTPESSSVSLQQFEDAPEETDGQYSHLPRLNLQHASGTQESQTHPTPTQHLLQPRAQLDHTTHEVENLPQRPAPQKQQRQSSLDALAMVCQFQDHAAPVPAIAAAASTFTAPMSVGTNDQDDTGTISSASTQVMSNATYHSDIATKSTSNRREDAFAASDPSVPSSSNGNFQFSHSDVLCGRGGLTNHHPGNVLFRKLVRSKQEEYLRATKRDKAGVAREIVDTIRHLNPPGRFLKKDPSNPGQWVEIGNRKAREKTSQALREGAPELREELNEAAAATIQQSQQQPQQQQSNLFLAPQMRTVTCEGMTMPDPMNDPPALRGRKVTEDGPAVAAALAEAQSELQHIQGYIHTTPPSGAGSHYIYDEGTSSNNHASPTQPAPTVVPMDTSSLTSSGHKRKLDNDAEYSHARRSPMPEACALQERLAHYGQDEHIHSQPQEEQCPSPGGTRGKGGPRIKMLKDRMRDFPCVQ